MKPPQIKTFYQSLIAVQTNYILAKLCQCLIQGIIIKMLSLKMRPHSVNIRIFQLQDLRTGSCELRGGALHKWWHLHAGMIRRAIILKHP